jgi:hypothetical protein
VLADELHGFGAARRFADDLESLLFEQVTDSRPEEVVIVDDQNAERLAWALLCCLRCLGQFSSPLGRSKSSGA